MRSSRRAMHRSAGAVLTFMGWDAAKAIYSSAGVYFRCSPRWRSARSRCSGSQFWRVPFMVRTYGWNEQQIGGADGRHRCWSRRWLGLSLGGVFVDWLAKRHKDANVRAAAIIFGCITVCTIASPLMPNGEPRSP